MFLIKTGFQAGVVGAHWKPSRFNGLSLSLKNLPLQAVETALHRCFVWPPA
jgi:hypothetical protein